MSIRPISIEKLDGGLNTGSPTTIKDNQLARLTNFYYNKDGQLQTRLGYTKFANALPKPITSYFFYQNDGTLATKAVCHAGDVFYELNGGGTTRVSKKTGLTEFETVSAKTSWRTRRDYAVYKNNIYMCDGVNKYAMWDGTTYTEYAAQPKVRYLSYMNDALFGAGDDTNPNTLYYTTALPADASTLNANLIVVGGDENGQINGLGELQTSVLAFKSNNVYAVNVTAQTSSPIDAQNGGYSDRSIHRVGDSLVYSTDAGVDTLKARSGVDGANALTSTPLSDNIKEIMDRIKEFNYNAQVAFYGKKGNNYYFSLDTNGDNNPDTTVVYSSKTKGRSTYSFPNIYDYGLYIDSAQQEHYVFASGTQMYEFETGLTDDGIDIEYELETKAYDFGEPGLLKTFDGIDVIGYKSIGTVISVSALVEGEVVSGGVIDDSNIDIGMGVMKTIGSSVLGSTPLTGGEDTSDIDLYQYRIRLPMYATGNDVAISMSSTGGTWTLNKARISVDKEPIDVFYSDNIL